MGLWEKEYPINTIKNSLLNMKGNYLSYLTYREKIINNPDIKAIFSGKKLSKELYDNFIKFVAVTKEESGTILKNMLNMRNYWSSLSYYDKQRNSKDIKSFLNRNAYEFLAKVKDLIERADDLIKSLENSSKFFYKLNLKPSVVVKYLNIWLDKLFHFETRFIRTYLRGIVLISHSLSSTELPSVEIEKIQNRINQLRTHLNVKPIDTSKVDTKEEESSADFGPAFIYTIAVMASPIAILPYTIAAIGIIITRGITIPLTVYVYQKLRGYMEHEAKKYGDYSLDRALKDADYFLKITASIPST